MKHELTNYCWVPDFPGTNCEVETRHWMESNLECVATREFGAHLPQVIVLPGGFSYGDYLRAGAIAARSESMEFVKHCALKNVPILGICNGFQILCETKILPGVLLPNLSKRHIHAAVRVNFNHEFENKTNTWFPQASSKLNQEHLKQKLELLISCGMGRYFCNEPVTTAALFYQDNLPGSQNRIAGITNDMGNVLGLMPHPERCSDSLVGGNSGLIFLAALAENRNIAVRKNSNLMSFLKEHNLL
jgi:phosphoribosylformylglycinamidine synthase subunit PurQ / glutaminase